MKRKVNLVGQGTLTVSLPTKWVKKYNVKKGDEVEVVDERGTIHISREGKSTIKSIEVKIHGHWKLKRRYIYNAYKLGYDTVKVNFDDVHDLKLVQEIVSTLIGFEVVGQWKNYCEIKSMASPNEEEVHVAIRRYFLLLISMTENTYEAFKKKEYLPLGLIAEQDLIINRYFLFLSRVIIKKGEGIGMNPVFLYHLLSGIENLGDFYRDICRHYSNKKINMGGKVLKFFKEVNALVRRFYELFYDFEPKKVEFTYNEIERLKKTGEAILAKERKDEMFLLHNLLTIVNYIYDLHSSLFGVIVR